MNVAFLGLGIMGSRMAANLLRSGYSLTVWNRTRERAGSLESLGARVADLPAEAVSGAEIVFTMLSTPEAVERTALGPCGFLPALTPGALWVDSSTTDPNFARRMAAQANERGIRFMDAPVTGSKLPAEQGQLRFLVGAMPEDLEAVRPLLEKMGTTIVHIGEPGMGASIKLVFNLMVGQAMLAFAEGMALGEALGIPRERLMDLSLGGPLVPPLLSTKRGKIESGDYEADFPMQWLRKDLHLAAFTAYQSGVALPMTNTAKEIYQLAVQSGLGEQDFSAIYEFLKQK